MHRQKGLSLVELMIATTLGLFLMGGVIQVLTSSQNTYNDLTNQARMQESAKLAMEYIVRDLRNVGYWGCNGQRLNVANAVFNGQKYNPEFHLQGWEEAELTNVAEADRTVGAFVIKPENVKDNTDVIVITIPDVEDQLQVTSDTGAAYHLNDSPVDANGDPVPKGTIWMVVSADCSNMVIFAQSNQLNGGQSDVVVGNTGNGVNDNCTKLHFGNYTCGPVTNGNVTPPGAINGKYPPGSQVFHFSKIAYSIEPGSANNVFALRRYGLESDASQQKLIEGISALEFTYGIDIDQDGDVDRFANAATVNSAFTDANGDGICDDGALCFKDVLSIAIDLTVQNPADSSQTQVFSTSVRLRNRGI